MSDVTVSPFPEGLWSQPAVATFGIAAIDGVEAVRSIRTPARLDYTYTAGISQSRFLRGMAEGKLLGERCPTCGKVYVPSRGACPVDGIPTEEVVELPSVGTVVSFCVVNVEFTGRGIEIPYAS
ncbi:MAG: zinc ribbon domain-containing protein, partial [Acidimicrobiales bacterium]